MNLEHHYRKMWTQSMQQFDQGRFEFDSCLNTPNDTRRGITLLARPSEVVKDSIKSMLDDLRTTESQQYYYPTSDIHVTVLSIISCYEGFTLQKIDTTAYVDLIGEALSRIPAFDIRFLGITASPSCLILQGFPSGDVLHRLRDEVRKKFRKSALQCSIDKRYHIQTAHSTVVRFKSPLTHPKLFLDKVKNYRDVDFGTFVVNEMDLVFHDWYQRAENTVLLERFRLNR
ncbi:MAG: mutarotase [Spirosomataceae bacterium]